MAWTGGAGVTEMSDIFFFAFVGAVATATGDTLASEIGETSKSCPRMITTLRPVEPGVDGGVTLLGEAASIFGALFTGVLAVATGMAGYEGHGAVGDGLRLWPGIYTKKD